MIRTLKYRFRAMHRLLTSKRFVLIVSNDEKGEIDERMDYEFDNLYLFEIPVFCDALIGVVEDIIDYNETGDDLMNMISEN